jgi:hypothetical protein
MGNRFPLDPNQPLQEAFQRRADQLTFAYFTENEPETGIRINILDV